MLFRWCAGYASTVDYFNLLQAYSSETDFTVWDDIVKNLTTLYALFERTDVLNEFKSFVIKLVAPVAEKIGYEKGENEGNLNKIVWVVREYSMCYINRLRVYSFLYLP